MALTLRRTEVHLTADGPLQLSQADGRVLAVTKPSVTVTWAGHGPISLQVTGQWQNPGDPLRTKVNARHRTVENLERTNPGLTGELKALVPQAPWDA